MKLYLWLITDPDGNVPETAPVHGVDYRKGNPCGRAHEYHTRDCKPVVFTEEDVAAASKDKQFVELIPFNQERLKGIVWGE